jgi:hypothetical protein
MTPPNNTIINEEFPSTLPSTQVNLSLDTIDEEEDGSVTAKHITNEKTSSEDTIEQVMEEGSKECDDSITQTIILQPPASENDTEINVGDTDDMAVPMVDTYGDDDIGIPGKVVNFINSDVKLLKVEVVINDQKVIAVLDSGAAKSLMSEKLANQLKISLNDENSSFKVIGNNHIETVGGLVSRVSIGGVEMCDQSFSVFPNPVISLILGTDFLENNHIEICVRKRIIIRYYSDGGRVEIYLDKEGRTGERMFCNISCYAASDTRVQQGKVKSIPIKLLSISSGETEMLLYDDGDIDPKLRNKMHGIAGVCASDQRTILMLATETDLEIKEGQLLGSVSSVLQLPDDYQDDHHNTRWTEESFKQQILLPELDGDQKSLVLDVLRQYGEAFSTGDTDIGHASVTKHKIRLTDETPIYQRPRRFPPPIAEEIERQCQELNALDIIEPSVSPWSAPVVPVRKKDGSIRMCIDYRQLNKVTVSDKFPVPNLSDSLFGLHGTQYFTRLDLVRGYYQIPIDEQSRELTAFSTPRNHWQFKRLSFGLKNAPAAFQREIQAVLSSFPSNRVVAYIDDILIMSNSFQEHLTLVSKVLQTLITYNIKIKPSKCEWFQSHVDYLGHTVSRTGIKKTASYVNKVADYPQSSTCLQ